MSETRFTTLSHSWFRTYVQYRGCPTPRAMPQHLFLLLQNEQFGVSVYLRTVGVVRITCCGKCLFTTKILSLTH